jgi:hypothetical protein
MGWAVMYVMCDSTVVQVRRYEVITVVVMMAQIITLNIS